MLFMLLSMGEIPTFYQWINTHIRYRKQGKFSAAKHHFFPRCHNQNVFLQVINKSLYVALIKICTSSSLYFKAAMMPLLPGKFYPRGPSFTGSILVDELTEMFFISWFDDFAGTQIPGVIYKKALPTSFSTVWEYADFILCRAVRPLKAAFNVWHLSAFDGEALVLDNCWISLHCHYFQIHSDSSWSYPVGYNLWVK